MAIKISGTNVINDSRQLENITNLKTVAGQSILGTGDIAIASGGGYAMQVFTNTTPGGTTWTKPAGLKAVKVTVVGGGAGTPVMPSWPVGGWGGGGGGAAIGYIPAPSIPGPVTVTVGIGGPATAPTTGGTSSFGAFMSATGGASGFPSGPGNNVGAGGLGTGGTFNLAGGDGGVTYTLSNPTGTVYYFVGAGGASILGIAPATKISISGISAFAGKDYGAGASGIYRISPSPNPSGAAGGQGIVIVEEFY